MRAAMILAGKELRDGMRNRWVAAIIVVLAALALSLSVLGSAPTGTLKAGALALTVVSLVSLGVYLLPLIALMLSFDALVGEFERGTMLLLLSHPVSRWQVVLGKFLGHTAILAVAILVGYGGAGIVIVFTADGDTGGGLAYLAMMASSLLQGAAFIGLGYMVSVLARERATAVGLAIGLWLAMVVLYDLALLGLLLADQGRIVGPQALAVIMLLNPADAYRIFNLAGLAEVGRITGLAGIAAETGLNQGLLLAVMALWVAVPLAITVFLFQRREL